MNSEIIRAHLEEMKADKKLDTDFVQLLLDSNTKNEEGKDTAGKYNVDVCDNDGSVQLTRGTLIIC